MLVRGCSSTENYTDFDDIILTVCDWTTSDRFSVQLLIISVSCWRHQNWGALHQPGGVTSAGVGALSDPAAGGGGGSGAGFGSGRVCAGRSGGAAGRSGGAAGLTADWLLPARLLTPPPSRGRARTHTHSPAARPGHRPASLPRAPPDQKLHSPVELPSHSRSR